MNPAAVAAARACLGTPFQHQGRQPGVGLDCVGLCVIAARAAGAEVDDVLGYSRRPHRGRLEHQLALQRCLQLAPVDQADFALMRFAREPMHLAVLAGDTIIHAFAQVGRVVEHGLAPEWRARIVTGYRLT